MARGKGKEGRKAIVDGQIEIIEGATESWVNKKELYRDVWVSGVNREGEKLVIQGSHMVSGTRCPA